MQLNLDDQSSLDTIFAWNFCVKFFRKKAKRDVTGEEYCVSFTNNRDIIRFKILSFENII